MKGGAGVCLRLGFAACVEHGKSSSSGAPVVAAAGSAAAVGVAAQGVGCLVPPRPVTAEWRRRGRRQQRPQFIMRKAGAGERVAEGDRQPAAAAVLLPWGRRA